MSNQTGGIHASGRMGLLGWLFIVFLVLKLNPGGHLDSPVQDWSWWWVTAPLWGMFALLLAIALIWVAGFVIGGLIQDRARRKRLENYRSGLAKRQAPRKFRPGPRPR